MQEKAEKATKAPTKPQRATGKRKRWFEASEYMLRGQPEGVTKRVAAKKGKRKRSDKTTKTGKTTAKKVRINTRTFAPGQDLIVTHIRAPRFTMRLPLCTHIHSCQAKVDSEDEALSAEARILPKTCSSPHICCFAALMLHPTHAHTCCKLRRKICAVAGDKANGVRDPRGSGQNENDDEGGR